ncbi:hypothetical protein Y032_0145g2478 [Ancylostoma ceylanicum]|nr:hypothetical protein Y032_0145g2478 [Ancylostoma ceylanicum]
MDTLMWTFPSMIRYRSRSQLSPATTADEMSQLSISSLSSPQPTNESIMIRARESPPKGLVEKRRAQFTQVERVSASADEASRAPRSRSVPISAVLLSAQQPQSRLSNEGTDSPTRQVQIDMVRYDFRAPADLLRRNPDDPIGSECGEAATTMERLSDGESRMVRVIREIGTDRDRRLTQPISRAAVLAASHSIPRGFPIVTVNVTDPKSTRRRTISEIPQPVVIEVRDNKSPRTTTIPVLRSPVTTSPLTSTMPRRTCSRAVQIEKYDSRTITIPPPELREVEPHATPEADEELASTSQLWSPLQHKPRQAPVPEITRWDDIVTENEISIKERELAIAKDTIKKLSIDLARLERDKQQLEIETRLQRQKSEAVLASRVADAITQIRSSSTEPETKPQIEKKRPHPPKFDPVAIKKECERMMEVLRQEGGGDQFSEEELAHASEVDREIERLKREVSAKRDSVMRTEQEQKQTSVPPQNSHSVASTSGEEDNASDSSQIISLKDQVVMYNGSNGTSNSKTALISKLERELTDAQTCNLRLNQKIGALVSSGNATLKKEVLELKYHAPPSLTLHRF